jgi:hypothetical protein
MIEASKRKTSTPFTILALSDSYLAVLFIFHAWTAPKATLRCTMTSTLSLDFPKEKAAFSDADSAQNATTQPEHS